MAQAERDGGHSTPPAPAESESESTDSEPEPDQAGGADVELVSAYNQRAQGFVQDHPDFGQVIDGLELPARIASTVEQSILEQTNGPQIAYQLATDPQLVSELTRMSPAQAAAEIGRLSERAFGDQFVKDQVGINLAYGEFAEIPGNVMAAFQERSRALHAENPLSEAEIAAAQAINIDARVSEMIIAMDAPELLHHPIQESARSSAAEWAVAFGPGSAVGRMKAELTRVNLRPNRKGGCPVRFRGCAGAFQPIAPCPIQILWKAGPGISNGK